MRNLKRKSTLEASLKHFMHSTYGNHSSSCAASAWRPGMTVESIIWSVWRLVQGNICYLWRDSSRSSHMHGFSSAIFWNFQIKLNPFALTKASKSIHINASLLKERNVTKMLNRYHLPWLGKRPYGCIYQYQYQHWSKARMHKRNMQVRIWFSRAVLSLCKAYKDTPGGRRFLRRLDRAE